MSLAPHPFSLRQLQYVVAVADSLSFRKAAERCHVSQPALSAQLALLEDLLELRLFERDRRRVIPTAAGRELVARARTVLRAADELMDAARNAKDPWTGTLRIGIIPTISPYLLPIAAPALRSAYPRLSIVWAEDKTEVLVKRLDEGTLDAALLALEAELGDVEWEALAKDPFVLATSTADPLGEKKSPAVLGELEEASVLLLDDGHCFREQALAFCTRAKAKELAFRATSLTTLAQMVAAGAGVTLLPELAVPTEVHRAELRTRPLAAPVPFRTIVLAWRKQSPLGEPLRTVATLLKDVYPTGAAQGASRRRPQDSTRKGQKSAVSKAGSKERQSRARSGARSR